MTRHLRDEQIQDALDGRLSAPEQSELQRHAGECEACRSRWEALELLRQAIRELPAPEPPAALAQAVATALDKQDGHERPAMRRRRWLYLAAGLVGLVTVSALTLKIGTRVPRVRSGGLLAEISADFEALRSGRQPLALRTSRPTELEAYFAASDLGFPTRVFDLAMMKQQLLGGSAGRLDKRPAALVAYRGEDGSLLVCRMLRGSLAELPAPQLERGHQGIVFRIYEAGGQTLVFWLEGEVLCVLVGDGPRGQVIELALAKAMKAAA